VRVWEDPAGRVVTLAVFEPPLNFQFDVDPRLGMDEALLADIFGWVEARRLDALGNEVEIPKAYAMLGHDTLSVLALDSDTARIAYLEANGYHKVERHNVAYDRSLAGPKLEVPPLPAGMRFRHATADDLDARAELHREAWSVWGPSQFSVSRYARLRSTPNYDETLDVVVEGPDGRLLSYCLAWFDPQNRIGHFEPVGTRPEVAGQGLGRAVVLEGLRRLQERGALTAFIGTASVNAPALRTYTACGFHFVEREHFYSKSMLA
jgi:ribosomal protein S18 acetylase RimI-like enzyme